MLNILEADEEICLFGGIKKKDHAALLVWQGLARFLAEDPRAR
ncbi:hypothetical protein GGQ95_003453 [Anoxybacillus rupiensis]|nr:hypothetical protein [Anoxybacillus rupiensis]